MSGEQRRAPRPPERRQRLGDQVYGDLLREITDGAFREVDRLPTEKELSRRFHVSRPVLREALTRLQTDGIVVSRQGSGTFIQRRPPPGLVAFASFSDVAALLRCFEARIAIESNAARYAATRRSEAHLARMTEAIDRLRSEHAAGGISPEADLAFHLAVAEGSQNEFFLAVISSLGEPLTRFMTVTLSMTREARGERAKRVLEEHERILEAIAAGDADGAGIAMAYHLDQARKRLTDRRRAT